MAAGRPLRHDMQIGKFCLGCPKISASTSPLTSGRLTLQIAISLIIMCGVRLSETNISPCNTKDKLKARITTPFSNLKKKRRKGLQEIQKSSGVHG